MEIWDSIDPSNKSTQMGKDIAGLEYKHPDNTSGF
jgi:hypothetical protein